MKNISKVFIGVDISKNNLDIYIHPIGKFIKIINAEGSIKALIQELANYTIEQIACEATGGYEKLLAQLLKKNNYKLWIVDPRRIKGFIIATGCKSKTDRIDARKIAEFASKNSPTYETANKSENHDAMQSLVNRKNDLIKFLVAEKTRSKHPSHAFCLPSIRKFIKVLENEIEAIDLQIQSLIKNDTVLDKKAQYLESIPGIGKASAATLLSFVPELGTLSNRKISALLGLCPYDYQSGKYNGKKYIRGGRVIPRNMLYMCALTSIRWHLPLKKFYDRLIANNKPFKVALVAVMHKLIILANALLKRGELCKIYN